MRVPRMRHAKEEEHPADIAQPGPGHSASPQEGDQAARAAVGVGQEAHDR